MRDSLQICPTSGWHGLVCMLYNPFQEGCRNEYHPEWTHTIPHHMRKGSRIRIVPIDAPPLYRLYSVTSLSTRFMGQAVIPS